MRLVWGALALITANCFATPAPLRFSVADSWAMPQVEIQDGRPTQGIFYDLMTSLAQQVGRPAEFHVLARARVQLAMQHGDIDVNCYTSPSWLSNQQSDYIWSVPLLMQRDVIVSAAEAPAQVVPQELPRQLIGTVLGYTYPTLQPLFDDNRLIRDDARNQELVLEKLAAGRYHYAVSSQWNLDRFNLKLPAEQQLREVAVLQEQPISCAVRNDPDLPVQKILRTLLKMKMSGEIDGFIGRYTGNTPSQQDLPLGGGQGTP